MGELDGMDGESPAATQNESGNAKDSEPKVTQKAMDEAIAATAKTTRTETLKVANQIAEAKEFVADWVGKLAMDAIAPADVYKAALDHLKVDVAGVDPSAFRKILEVQPKPGAGARQMAVDAQVPDASGTSGRFPGLLDDIRISAS